ncbi:hypothetical protein BG004_007745 [Podila humilis]|nr:hypothetical protein BG004_007745 [Podila humilis]
MENLNQFLLILVQNHKSINTLAVAFSVELKRSNRSLDKALRIILELDLVSLKIDLEGSLQHGALAYVLEKCPLLEYLSIGDWNETNRPGDLATNNNNNNSPRCCPRLRSFRTRRLKDLHSSILTVAQCAPNLEALEVEDQEGDDDDVGQANVANLLFSPRLENLCVQLRKSCPNLNSLSLNCYAMDSEGIATLLRATPNLKSLRVNEYELPVTLNILVECPDSFPLLESVYLKHYEQTHSSFSNLLGRLLQQKPALRELRVRGHDVVDKSCMELLHPWACKNLETLEVDFGVLDGGLSEQLRVSVCELFNAQLDGLPKFKENPMYPAREIL